MTWEPDNASLPIEEEMERKGLPESDRDEVRRLAAFLAWRKRAKQANQNGAPPPDMPPDMKAWLLGENQTQRGGR